MSKMLLRTPGSRTRVKVPAVHGPGLFVIRSSARPGHRRPRIGWTSREQFSPPRLTRHHWLPHASSRRSPKESVT